jgi:hypothetical protein
MTTTVERPPRNGVDVPTLFATLDAAKGAPHLAKFQFRATNEWISGTHSRSFIQGFYGAGQEDTSRTAPFMSDEGHSGVLLGSNQAPRPIESLQHAIASCPTAGLANIAAPGESLCSASPPGSRATSTCSASSVCPARYVTATGRSGCRLAAAVVAGASSERSAALAGYQAQRDRTALANASHCRPPGSHAWDLTEVRRLLRELAISDGE